MDDLVSDRPHGRPSLHLSASNPSFSNLSLSPSGRPLSPAGPPSSSGNLNCTLFLFDDKLVITKRQHPTVNGRKATGLDDLNKMMRGGGGLLGLAQSGAHLTKDKLSFKGMVDLLDVTAVGLDAGGERACSDCPTGLITDAPWTHQSSSFSFAHHRTIRLTSGLGGTSGTTR